MKAEKIQVSKEAREAALDRMSDGEATKKECPQGAEFLDAVKRSTLDTADLKAMDLPPKEKFLGDFFQEADFGFIFAPRGLGKTWLALAVADGLASGQAVGEWEAGENPHDVLIVDGEMSLAESKARAESLDLADNIEWLHHESLFQKTERVLNLSEPAQQEAITAYCQETGKDVLILDNLSCLFFGIRENDADDWGERILPWILRLRRIGIAVIIVAHAGRNGEMRGTSKREDHAHWVIKLKIAPRCSEDAEGARFVSAFTKNRHSPENRSPSLLWEFVLQDDATKIVCKAHRGYDAFLEMVQEGVETQQDIADEMGVNKATVSKWAKRGETAGRIRKDGRKLLWIA